MKVKQMIDEFPRRLQYREGSAGYHSEDLDTTPLVVPFDCKKPETLEQAIARIMQIRDAKQLDEEWESEDEAEDFDCENEDELLSPYELFDDSDFSQPSGALETDKSAGGETPPPADSFISPTARKRSVNKAPKKQASPADEAGELESEE